MILSGFVSMKTDKPISVFKLARKLSFPLEVSTDGECGSSLEVPSRTFREFLVGVSPLIVPFEKEGKKVLIWGYIQLSLPSNKVMEAVELLTSHNCPFRMDWDKEETYLTIDPDKIEGENTLETLRTILFGLEKISEGK